MLEELKYANETLMRCMHCWSGTDSEHKHAHASAFNTILCFTWANPVHTLCHAYTFPRRLCQHQRTRRPRLRSIQGVRGNICKNDRRANKLAALILRMMFRGWAKTEAHNGLVWH